MLKQTTVDGKKIAKDTIMEISEVEAKKLIKAGNAKLNTEWKRNLAAHKQTSLYAIFLLHTFIKLEISSLSRKFRELAQNSS